MDVELPATIAIDDTPHECVVSNLSLGGAQIGMAAGARGTMGDRAVLRFLLAVIGEWVDTSVVVRWRTGTQLGVQYDGLRAREVWALNQFFKGYDKAAS